MEERFARYLMAFDERHRDAVVRNDPDKPHRAVIIDSRRDLFLPMVLRNVMHFLGEDWNLQVFCGTHNQAWLQRHLDGWAIDVSVINVARIPVAQYNRILMSEAFWQRFPENDLLVFQADSLMCGHHIADFMEWDYIGAPCMDGSIYNGGFSYRKREAMLAAIATHGQAPQSEVEDVFFSKALRAEGARLPDPQTAARFSVESHYVAHPVGVHGTDKYYLSEDVVRRIIGGIEE